MTKEWEKPEDLRRRKPVLWLTMTALFMAMVVVLSMSALSIPVPGGHLYFNDVVIDTAAMLMDPLSAFIACGVGAFLGDLLFYPAPMFVSLITHGLQALVISLLCRKLRMKQPLACAIAVLAGAIVMVVGYTLGRAFVYSTPEYAIMKLPFQCLQAGVGAVTYFPKIPVPVTGGYVHLGDGAIFLSVLLLGPLGIPAAAVGSMLSDLIGGYMVYVLPTFLIKGLVALVAWKLCRKDQPLLAMLSFLLAEAVMVLGYFLLEWALYGVASAAAAIGPNVVQGIAGVLIGMLCLLITPRLERVAKL